MNDNPVTDTNPPFYAKVVVDTYLTTPYSSKVKLVINAGAEESVERLDDRFSSSAASLLDKETIRLQPVR